MCRTYASHIICRTCRAIQPGVFAVIEYRDPNCEEECRKPWPGGKPEEEPQLAYVDVTQCSFCQKVEDPEFLEEKQGQENFVRGELEWMRTLFADRAEEKRKRREKRLKRKVTREGAEVQESEVQEAEVQEVEVQGGEVRGVEVQEAEVQADGEQIG